MTEKRKMFHNITAFLLLLFADGIVIECIRILSDSIRAAGAEWADALRAVLLLTCNLVWAILLGLFMVVCFFRNASPFTKSAFDPALPFMKRFEVPGLILFLLIQLVGDAVSYWAGQYLGIALIWLAGYWLFTRKKPGIFNKPKLLTAMLIVLIASAAGCPLIESVLLRNMTGTAVPLTGGVLEYLRYLEVSQRVNAVLSFVCNTVIGCAMICLHVHAAAGSAKDAGTAQ